MARPRQDSEFMEKIIEIRRVTRVVAGGKRTRFRVLVAVGDGKGRVGIGLGKASEVPDAVVKAIQKAKKNMIKVPMAGTTIPHVVEGKLNTSRVLLKPAVRGTGLIAGRTVRMILELAGFHDIISKAHGSTNATNLAYATINALKNLRTPDEVAKLRGKDVRELLER